MPGITNGSRTSSRYSQFLEWSDTIRYDSEFNVDSKAEYTA